MLLVFLFVIIFQITSGTAILIQNFKMHCVSLDFCLIYTNILLVQKKSTYISISYILHFFEIWNWKISVFACEIYLIVKNFSLCFFIIEKSSIWPQKNEKKITHFILMPNWAHKGFDFQKISTKPIKPLKYKSNRQILLLIT